MNKYGSACFVTILNGCMRNIQLYIVSCCDDDIPTYIIILSCSQTWRLTKDSIDYLLGFFLAPKGSSTWHFSDNQKVP
jgi:hypothetical protein